jgi:hypothetical protein
MIVTMINDSCCFPKCPIQKIYFANFGGRDKLLHQTRKMSLHKNNKNDFVILKLCYETAGDIKNKIGFNTNWNEKGRRNEEHQKCKTPY